MTDLTPEQCMQQTERLRKAGINTGNYAAVVNDMFVLLRETNRNLIVLAGRKPPAMVPHVHKWSYEDDESTSDEEPRGWPPEG